MLEGIAVPSEAYRGGYRGEQHPDLRRYAVAVGDIPAVLPQYVGGELTGLLAWLCDLLPDLDERADRLGALARTTRP